MLNDKSAYMGPATASVDYIVIVTTTQCMMLPAMIMEAVAVGVLADIKLSRRFVKSHCYVLPSCLCFLLLPCSFWPRRAAKLSN